MSNQWVKVCPECGHLNAEYNQLCVAEGCDAFLGGQSSEPSSGREATAELTTRSKDNDPGPGERSGGQETAAAALVLETPGFDATFRVRNGDTVGRGDMGSTAEVQLNGLPALNLVHRRHCRFELCNGRWYCTPLDEGTFHPPNPTIVNGEFVPPGQSRPLDDGDRLSLANTHLVVRLS